MTFIDREKQRLIPLKPQLFSAEAVSLGTTARCRAVSVCAMIAQRRIYIPLSGTRLSSTSRNARSAGTIARRVVRAITCVVPSVAA